MPPPLSILTVPRAEPAVRAILDELAEISAKIGARFVLVADGDEAARRSHIETAATVYSRGFIESVLDQALTYIRSGYVLRLDDDELPSAGMIRWLEDGEFRRAEHWSFPRVHLFRDRRHALLTHHLYPDHQTRLSIKAKAGGRTMIHCGSPFGYGEIAD